MDLTVRQAGEYLGVSEAETQRWIAQRGLPVHRAYERVVIDPVELFEWATAQRITASRSLLEQARRASDAVAPIAELLRAGGVNYDIDAADKSGILRAIVARLVLPPDVDRDRLLSVLAAREATVSWTFADGVAIPLMRNAIIANIDQPSVTLSLLTHPAELGAPDGMPVHAVFTIVSPTASLHLRVLAQLAFVLRDDALRELLRARAPASEIIDRAGMLQKARTTAMFRAIESE